MIARTLAFLVLLLPMSAHAQLGAELEARVPKTVGEFVPHCTGRFVDCRRMVALVDIDRMSQPKAAACSFGTPDAKKDMDAATRSIVAWLVPRKEAQGLATRAGISAAMKALWRC